MTGTVNALHKLPVGAKRPQNVNVLRRSFGPLFQGEREAEKVREREVEKEREREKRLTLTE